ARPRAEWVVVRADARRRAEWVVVRDDARPTTRRIGGHARRRPNDAPNGWSCAPTPAPAPHWWSCVGRGFFRAWPRYARSKLDDHRVDAPSRRTAHIRAPPSRMMTRSTHRQRRGCGFRWFHGLHGLHG